MENIAILDAGVIALLGYATVFLGLIMLMVVVMIIGKIFTLSENKKKQSQAVPAPAPVVEAPKATAPGSAGEIKLFNVEPRTAAMLMAIVADKMGKPINELRFISIKEVE